MKYLKDYIQNSLADGKYFFTKEEVCGALNLASSQFKQQAYRLSEAKKIYRLASSFYMIIPAEYFHLGSLPPHWIVDPLLKYLGHTYYIGLLSAASLYGATLQQPMSFQVIIDNNFRNILLERSQIEFHSFKYCEKAHKELLTTPTGYAAISTREQTILDLIRFYPACGYLSNVATVIADLTEQTNPATFRSVVETESNVSLLQRVGYILELIGQDALAETVGQALKAKRFQLIPLRPELKSKSGEQNKRWKILVNDSIEIEE